MTRKDKASQLTSQPAQPLIALPAPDAADDDDEDGDGGYYSLDHRDRLLVPTAFLQAIGAQAGKTVHVNVGNQSVTVMNHSLTANDKTYTVEPKGHIRMSRQILAEAGMSSDKFDISVVGGQICVREAVIPD